MNTPNPSLCENCRGFGYYLVEDSVERVPCRACRGEASFLPCPFCAGEAGFVIGCADDGRMTHTVFCDGCHASAATEFSRHGARRNWNRRDSDGPRMAETNEDSARGEAGPARAEGIAHP